jgi:ABC-type branched-subunit amino acid transport system substrate-binding protein
MTVHRSRRIGGRCPDPSSSRPAAIAVLVVLALLAAACGARVQPYLGAGPAGVTPGAGGQTAAGGASAAGGGAAAPGATSGATPALGSPGPAPPGTAGSGPAAAPSGGAPAAGLSGLTPASFPYSPAQQAALCAGASGNTASAVGVTPTAITLGNVSGLTGILANNFNQGPEAVQALFSATNAAGGICGRQVKLLVEDDGQDAGKNAADVADEIPKVLAFVGSTSDADNGGVQEMVNSNVPDLGVAINGNRGSSSVYWSTNGATQYVANGHPEIYDSYINGLKGAGNFPSKIATLAYSIAISAQAGQEFHNEFVHDGSQSCFTDFSVSPATASLDQDVLEMKSKGCNGVFTTMDVTGTAKLLAAMARQNFHPVFKGTTFDGYTQSQIEVANTDSPGSADGLEAALPFLPLSDGNPIVNLYLSELRTYEPGKQPSGFGLESWATAEMFLYALLKAGRNPTRASLTQALQAIDSWNTGGATAPITPRLRQPAGPCTMDVVVRGNSFTRKWPSNGFFCTGKLVPVG